MEFDLIVNVIAWFTVVFMLAVGLGILAYEVRKKIGRRKN